MTRLLLALFVAVLAVTCLQPETALAQDAVPLKYAPVWQEGVVQETEVEVKSDQILTISGMPLESHADSFLTMSEKVVGSTPAGGWSFEGGFSLVQSDIELPGGLKLSFNSNNPDQADSGGQLGIFVEALKATAGAKWVAEIDAEHQLTKMEYIDDPFANVDPTLRGNTDPEAIKKQRKNELKRYPAEAVKPGETWTVTEEKDLGGGQTITLEKEYTYAGSEQKNDKTLDKVTVKVLSAEYKMDPNSPSPAKVTDAELKVAESGGTYWYDRQMQVFGETEEKVRMTGTLSLEVGGQKLPGELDLTIESGSKTKLTTP